MLRGGLGFVWEIKYPLSGDGSGSGKASGRPLWVI